MCMNNNIDFSIITVVYNGEENIEKTILSVIDQSYKNFEYIIIDGASTDSTVEIIKKYENSIDYFISEKDNGIYDAMNKAIKVAKGKWINFMNCGDTFCDNEVLHNIIKNSISDFSVIYGNVVRQWNSFIEVEFPNKKNFTMPFCHQSCFTKTEYLKKYGFDLSFKICADRNFYKVLQKNDEYKALYLDLNISNFDSINGVSSKNEILMLKEKSIIENMKKIKLYSLILKLKIKNIINSLFPEFINNLRKFRAHRNYLNH